MKNIKIVLGVIALLLVGTGVLVYKAVLAPKPTVVEEEEVLEVLPEVSASIGVEITKSKSKDNTVVLAVSGLDSKYSKLSYELSYETQGIVQGVTSAPVDISGKDTFERNDIYLGTCSKNVCKPHTGVTSVTAVVVFTDVEGQKSQFSKEYEL